MARLCRARGDGKVPSGSTTALAAEDAALRGRGLGRARLDRADLGGGVGVPGVLREDLLEVAQRLPVAAEHALDAAEVEPRELRARRFADRPAERLTRGRRE